MKDVLALLKTHQQLYKWSCAASAHEFMAKLHNKLAAAEFPLQDNPDSVRKGFQFESFLNGIGFTSHDDHQLPQDALDILSKETAAERFPLVSICSVSSTFSPNWQIAVAVPVGAEVALVDPARQEFLTHDSAETLNLLQKSVSPSREMINFLTYREKATSQGTASESA